MTLKDVSKLTELNYQGMIRKFPQYTNKTLSQEDIKSLHGYYRHNPKVEKHKLDKLERIISGASEHKKSILPIQQPVQQQNPKITKEPTLVKKESKKLPRLDKKTTIYSLSLLMLISIQSYHFHFIVNEAEVFSNRVAHPLINYMTGILFELTAILITVDRIRPNSLEEDRKNNWLYMFAFIAFVTNSIYFRLFEDMAIYQFGSKLIASVALPTAILAFSYLFNKNVGV